ncbi:hypothetical protein ABW20_dc0106097 [Dactylellina cionopaga]|nr:hypothetical protein ABW20_dc0106097 [Dactylellina cionopaga]
MSFIKYEEVSSKTEPTNQPLANGNDPSQAPNLKLKLPISYTIILLTSTIAIVAAVSLLLYLWIETRRLLNTHVASSFWYAIIQSGWLEQTITLTAVVIRTAITSQAAVCIAMLGSLVLEHKKARLVDIPKYAMIRAGMGSPWDFISGVNINGGSFSQRVGFEWIAGFILLLTALGTQFTSTILLSDLTTAQYSGKLAEENVTIGLNFTGNYNGAETLLGTDPWKSQPPSYPRFAEYTEGPSMVTGCGEFTACNSTENEFPGVWGYQDSGLTIRSLLPFSNQSVRNAVREYNGYTTVFSSRFLCAPPRFDNAEIGFGYLGMPQTQGVWGLWLGGNDSSRILAPIVLTSQLDRYTTPVFNCTIGYPRPSVADANGDWPLSICNIGTSDTTDFLVSDLNEFATGSTLGVRYLVFNITHHEKGFDGPLSEQVDRGRRRLKANDPFWNVTEIGVWKRYSVASDPSTHLDVSLCLGLPEATYKPVFMSTNTPLRDEILRYDVVKAAYDTSNIRDLLGTNIHTTTNASHSPGAFALRPQDWILSDQRTVVDTRGAETFESTLPKQQPNTSITLCEKCAVDAPGTVAHRAHVRVFQDTLKDTGNLAVAMSSLWAILIQMGYYEYAPEFSIPVPASYTLFESRSIPIRWRGLLGVLVLIGIHLITTIITTIVFFYKSKLPFIGETWQAVAQVSRGATAATIVELGNKGDREVRNTLRRRSGNLQYAGVARNPDTGTVEVVTFKSS